ncbi:pyrimidine operon attenuation protein / uracil phosphoribosyltransferase [Pustulibacterium marinum]|uniref:Pyrimidine operon attenuation protein / uracil phosphoribosyltransferase n=1 Tax=Pustulibacterium marinum TaxID=1224947 RepID=A0A1I7FRC5_9FLAO|nr:phosphoribosyltransferase family protein [Pustulibacterium marinum]SFU38774.1 pyrimidine operon attenuation protein / uracil phosphoribosyltransferase [Pustulibacterium marinum]
MQNTILSHEEIQHKIKRIAYQIYETNIDEEEIVIAGINGNGFTFAEKIKTALDAISEMNVILCEVYIHKDNPLEKHIDTSIPPSEYTNKPLVLVDDVLNSGTVLMYGVKHFLEVPLRKFKTAVLVNRNHKKYPIKADFKGISLSTSLQERINVVFENGSDYAYLE